MIIQVKSGDFLSCKSGELSRSSEELKQTVIRIREVQKERFKGYTGIFVNAQMNPEMLKKYCQLNSECDKYILERVKREDWSARKYHRMLRVARTLVQVRHTTLCVEVTGEVTYLEMKKIIKCFLAWLGVLKGCMDFMFIAIV